MKFKFLIPAFLKILVLGSLSVAYGQLSPQPDLEEPVGEEEPVVEEDQELVEEVSPEERERLILEERSKALLEVVKTQVLNTKLKTEKRNQLRAMVMEAYRNHGVNSLWSDVVSRMEDSLESLRELLILHGFEETELSFSYEPDADEIEGRISWSDLVLSLSVAEVCLRLKEGPESVSEWPNWRFSDQPIPQRGVGYYDEITSRFGKIGEGSLDPVQVAEGFIPKNWIYHRIHQEILREPEGVEPPVIEIEKLIKVGHEFPQALELAEFLSREGFFPEEELGPIDGVYTESLSQGIRDFQKEYGLQSDGILGASTAREIAGVKEKDMDKLLINLHRARRLPDSMGDRYLLANLPSGEVHGFDDGEEMVRMRVVFGKDKAGQQTPIFRDEMEEVVFRPYWSVPYSIAIGERNYSNLSYLEANSFKIISSSSGASLPLTSDSLNRVAQRKAYVRQDGGGRNALGLVKVLFPNKHAVYFHDTPAKHYFKNTYRAQSHGCVRLQEPELMANWVLKDYENWDPGKVNAAIHRGSRIPVDLKAHIPVYIVYLTAFPDPKETEGVAYHNDVYDYDLPGAIVDAPGPKIKPAVTTTEKKRRPLFNFKRQRQGRLIDRIRALQN